MTNNLLNQTQKENLLKDLQALKIKYVKEIINDIDVIDVEFLDSEICEIIEDLIFSTKDLKLEDLKWIIY